EIVRDEVEKMLLRLKGREVAPAIVEIQEQLERIRTAEISRMRRRLGPLSPEQAEAIDALTRGIVNKIAHGPISEMRKHAADPDGVAAVDILRRAFRIESATPASNIAEEADAFPGEAVAAERDRSQ